MYKIKYTNFNKIGGMTSTGSMILDDDTMLNVLDGSKFNDDISLNGLAGTENVRPMTENEKFLDDLEDFGDQMVEALKNLDSQENLDYIKNIITKINKEFTIDNSLNLTDLYTTFLNHIMDDLDYDFLLGKIFKEDEHQLGLLFQHGRNYIQNFTPTIDQLGLLLQFAYSKDFKDFLFPIKELYKQNEAYRILKPIYPNNSTALYDYLLQIVKEKLFNTHEDIFTWILFLESEFGPKYVQDFLSQVFTSTLITSNFQTLLNNFVRNRIETFTESILSMHSEPETNIQHGTNVQLSSQDKLYFYKPIIEHILRFFSYDPYIKKVGFLPVASSSKENFDLYMEKISQLIQQDRHSFFSGLIASSRNWDSRDRLKEILNKNEDDVDTIVDGKVIYKDKI